MTVWSPTRNSLIELRVWRCFSSWQKYLVGFSPNSSRCSLLRIIAPSTLRSSMAFKRSLTSAKRTWSSAVFEVPLARMLRNSISKLSLSHLRSRPSATLWAMAISFNCSFPASHQTRWSVKAGLLNFHDDQKELTAAQKLSFLSSCVLNFHTPRPRGLVGPNVTWSLIKWWSGYAKDEHVCRAMRDLQARGVSNRSSRHPTEWGPLRWLDWIF